MIKKQQKTNFFFFNLNKKPLQKITLAFTNKAILYSIMYTYAMCQMYLLLFWFVGFLSPLPIPLSRDRLILKDVQTTPAANFI